MQNASWLRLKQTSPCSRSLASTTGMRVMPWPRRAPAPPRPGPRAPRAACRRARAGRSGRRRSSGRSAGVSVPRKRSPSVTSSSFLRGLKNAAGLGERHVGPDALGPAHHHVADSGPGLVDRDVDRRTHGSPKCGARLSRNARTPSRPSGAADRPAIVWASSSSCLLNGRRRGAAQQPLDRAVRADRALGEPQRQLLGLGVELVVGHDAGDDPELLRARRRQALVEQRELHRACAGRRAAAASSSPPPSMLKPIAV